MATQFHPRQSRYEHQEENDEGEPKFTLGETSCSAGFTQKGGQEMRLL